MRNKNEDEVRLTIKPGLKGTKKLLGIYGQKLVCVRYRYNRALCQRYKTVELIIDQIYWKPKESENTYKPTHILKKDFIVHESPENEIYKKGSYVLMRKRHRKHEGFCCNIAFVTKKGKIRTNKDQALAMFDKSFFYPLKNWFEPIGE